MLGLRYAAGSEGLWGLTKPYAPAFASRASVNALALGFMQTEEAGNMTGKYRIRDGG